MIIGGRPDNRDEPPIAEIDFDEKTFRRLGRDTEPFPERWYTLDMTEWSPAPPND